MRPTYAQNIIKLKKFVVWVLNGQDRGLAYLDVGDLLF